MKKFLYPIYALPIYTLVLLPFPIYYLLSDFLFVLGYYVIGYRKKVIHQNLRNSFPHKSEAEIKQIGKKYYGFMIDLFLETFKQLVMSPQSIQRRFKFINPEALETFKQQNRPIIFVLGHYGNWEWCGQSFHLKHMFQQDVLYHPLSNPFFDWITYKLRARWGVGLIPMQVSIKEMIRRKDMLTATAFLADQTPSNKDACHWMPFLNQDTPVFLGTEKIAKKLNRPVVFVHLNRIKRGYYETTFTVISASPKDTPDNWITEQHTQLLETDIIKCPELWLWSHRRWKHKRTQT
ncbi:MAG: lysophospholipid acyltransferase family protein [Bacteroidota bacterium]